MIIIYKLYIHKNKINGKEYCGITKNTSSRWSNNGKQYYNRGREKQTDFYNAILEFGWDNFEHIILEEGLTKEQAEIKEIEYIKTHNLQNAKYGYNIAKGGKCDGILYRKHPKGMLGKTHSEKYKAKLREMMKGEKNHCQKGFWSKNNRKHPKGMLGKTHSTEKRQQISETCKINKINCKQIIAILPNKEEIEFDSMNELMDYLNISTRIVYKLLKSGEPYKFSSCSNKQYINHLKSLEGLIIKRKDNTEVI